VAPDPVKDSETGGSGGLARKPEEKISKFGPYTCLFLSPNLASNLAKMAKPCSRGKMSGNELSRPGRFRLWVVFKLENKTGTQAHILFDCPHTELA
jgi:hypothetical protein